MVVILPAAQYEEWLDAPPARSMEFLRQYAAEQLLATPESVRRKAASGA